MSCTRDDNDNDNTKNKNNNDDDRFLLKYFTMFVFGYCVLSLS